MVVWAAGGCGPQQQCTVPKCFSLTYFVCRLPPPMRGTSASTWPAGQGNKAIHCTNKIPASGGTALKAEEHARISSLIREAYTLCLCFSNERFRLYIDYMDVVPSASVFDTHACSPGELYLESIFPREHLASLPERPCPPSNPRDALIRISHPAISCARIALTPSDIAIGPSWQDHPAAEANASLEPRPCPGT